LKQVWPKAGGALQLAVQSAEVLYTGKVEDFTGLGVVAVFKQLPL
jgi:hypothetical protein